MSIPQPSPHDEEYGRVKDGNGCQDAAAEAILGIVHEPSHGRHDDEGPKVVGDMDDVHAGHIFAARLKRIPDLIGLRRGDEAGFTGLSQVFFINFHIDIIRI